MITRKSQLYSQIFAYILAIVIISFIIVYGYTAVSNFKNRAEQVACLKLKSDLQAAIESISTDFGTVKRKDIQLCAGYREICFVEGYEDFDINTPAIYNPTPYPVPIDPIIKDSIKSETGRNVFLVDNIAKDSFYVGNISVYDDVYCIKAVNNEVSLRLEGKGDHTELREWT